MCLGPISLGPKSRHSLVLSFCRRNRRRFHIVHSTTCAAPSALIALSAVPIHALTDVAIEYRPFGPAVDFQRSLSLKTAPRKAPRTVSLYALAPPSRQPPTRLPRNPKSYFRTT